MSISYNPQNPTIRSGQVGAVVGLADGPQVGDELAQIQTCRSMFFRLGVIREITVDEVDPATTWIRTPTGNAALSAETRITWHAQDCQYVFEVRNHYGENVSNTPTGDHSTRAAAQADLEAAARIRPDLMFAVLGVSRQAAEAARQRFGDR